MSNKTRNLILIAVGVLIVSAFIGFKSGLFYRPCEQPERPAGIPLSAKWNGGCDGGYWIDLVDVRDDKYRFRIYLDYAAIVTMDADFTLADSCKGMSIPSDSSILSKIAIVSEESVLIRLEQGGMNKDCYMVPVYPAYGGETWEIIKKEKGY